MKIHIALFSVLLTAGVAFAQETEELTPYSLQEIDQITNTFLSTYKNKKQPEEDAIAALGNLKKAYRYLHRARKEGEPEMSKDEVKSAKKIVALIAKKGLKVRKREQVALECARVLGEIGDPAGAKPLKKWLENVLDEKAPHPSWVEYGFQSLAWIGPQDSGTLDFILKYAATGRHPDMGVANHAIKACYVYRELNGKVRKEFFNKINGYVGGLYSQMRGGEAKSRATYEQRYNSVKENALTALAELAGDGSKFANPTESQEWWSTNKKRNKWEPYVGTRVRAAAAAKKAARKKAAADKAAAEKAAAEKKAAEEKAAAAKDDSKGDGEKKDGDKPAG